MFNNLGGTHFVTASCAPRMQVDNLLQVWDLNGKKCFEWKAPKHLYGVVPFKTQIAPPFASELTETIAKSVQTKASMPSIDTFFECFVKIVINA